MTAEPTPAEVILHVGHTAVIDPAVLERARAMLDIAFDSDVTEHDWEHALGGMHVIAARGDEVVGHASVVQRRLVHHGVAMRTGYVEGVAVHPGWQRRGIGGRMMGELEAIITAAYDIGALGASSAAIDFYLHRGWVRWLGPASAITPTGIVRTEEEEGWIFVFPGAQRFDIHGELTCDWRDGDVW